MNLDIDGWCDGFEQAMFDQIIDRYDNCLFAELGSFKGKSAVYMARRIKEKGKNIKLVCIDLWPAPHELERTLKVGAGQGAESDKINERGESLMQEFVDNINKYDVADIIMPVRTYSELAADYFPDNYFSFVYVDAGHEYDHVIRDIQAWLPKVEVGGVLGGHDYGGEVKRAVDEQLNNRAVQFHKDAICWYYLNEGA